MIKKLLALTCALAYFSCGAAAHANNSSDVDWFEFSGWSHSAVFGSGQDFTDIFNNLDVSVTGTSNSYITTVFRDDIQIGGNTDAMSMQFDLSEPTDIVVEFNTIDLQEILTIGSSVTPTYAHGTGQMPTLSNNLEINGTGFGITPMGASNGFVTLLGVTSFSVGYEALANDKYEVISIGALRAVPEPSAGILMVLGSLLAIRRWK